MKEIKHRSDCPISYGLDFFGDKWTLLIVRDIVIYNKNTFGDFLNADEKMATNILSDRLKTLETEGFLLKYAVPGKGKVAYCLTEKGITLVPIIVELSAWGSAHNENNDSTKREAFAKALKKSKSGLISQLQAKLLKDYQSHLPA